MADIARLALQIDVNGAQRARTALKGLQDGSIRAERATNQLARSNQSLARTSRISTNGLRNVSLQLSQVAQQGAATGNFLQALAIQLPDLALAFGPVGIALGAVAGGLASYILGARQSAEETDSFIEKIDKLDVSYQDLNDEIRETLRLEKARAEAELQNQIAELSTELRIAEQRVKSYNNALNATGQAGARFGGAVDPEKLKEAEENVIEFEGELGFLGLRLTELRKRYDEYINGTDESAEATERAQEKVEDLNETLRFQVETYGQSERAVALAKIQQLEKNGADEEAIRVATRLTNALFDKKEAEEAAADAEERRRQIARAMTVSTGDDPLLQRIEAEKRGQEILLQQQEDYATARQNLDQQILQSAATTAGNLASVVGQLAGRQSNAYRAAFLAQQAFAIASSIVNTQLAATAALAPPPIGLGPVAGVPYANTIQGLGAANIAIIAGQTIAGLAGTYTGGDSDGTASFEGGGFTGFGSRSGGVDGRGGFPAILHPNETVVDHARGQGTGGSMIVNVNNAPQGTRVEQRTDNQGNQIADVFIADVANGGPMSKTMQSTFGLRRQGR